VLPQCAGDEVPFVEVDNNGPQAPYRVDRTLETPRNGNISSETGPPGYPIDYVELMPCINTCTRVDQRCSSALQWNCPRRQFNANESYAFVSDSDDRGDGSAETGWPATDVYGNRWCNGL
jgi:calcium channel MID1